MALNDELSLYADRTFSEEWTERNGLKVPTSEDVKLMNDGVSLDAVVLYADLSSSTYLVDNSDPQFAAEVYKVFLYCAARIIRAEGGEITSYDGDRVMGIFIGKLKKTSAVRAALKICYAVNEIINPSLASAYQTEYEINHTVAIDSSPIFAARTGIRGSNDLVWVGQSANYAAKMTSLPPDKPTWITESVFSGISSNLKKKGARDIWQPMKWEEMGGIRIYRSSWYMPF